MKAYKRNIRLLAGLEFSAYFGITSFWVLFFIQNGMSLLQIGLLESIFHGTSILFEIPSGMLADRFSYKTNLYIARLMSIACSVLILLGQGKFWIYALSMVVQALSYNFDSGTSTAMLYESAVEAGLKDRYLTFSSLLSGVAEVTRTLGTVLAGFFVHGGLQMTYFIAIGLSFLSMLFIFLMKEPSGLREEVLTLRGILQLVGQEWRRSPAVFAWMLVFQVLAAIMCMFYYYYQQQLPDLQAWQISAVMLVGSGLNLVAVYLATYLGKKWSLRLIFPFLAALTGVTFALTLMGGAGILIGIYLLTNALYALFQPLYYNELQGYLPSGVRATMLSISSMFFSFGMAVVFPLTGWLIDILGFGISFVGIGLLLLVLAPCVAVILKKLNTSLEEVLVSD